MTEHMHDLGIEALPGGVIRLEQSAGSQDGAVFIDLHPCQLRLIAERAGLPTVSRELRRDLNRLRDRAAGLLDLLESVPSFPPGRETADIVAARDLLDAVDDMLDDHLRGDDSGEPVRPIPHQHGANGTVPANPINVPIVSTDDTTAAPESAQLELPVMP